MAKKIGVIYCKKAHAVMNCPMNLSGIQAKLEESLGIPVKVGTHDW